MKNLECKRCKLTYENSVVPLPRHNCDADEVRFKGARYITTGPPIRVLLHICPACSMTFALSLGNRLFIEIEKV